MNQETKNKMADIIASQLAEKPIIKEEILPEITGEELSNLTIDDILNEKTCAPCVYEVPVPSAKVPLFEIINYSDKSFAVFGNTKPVKDDLKKLGGRFNPFLKYGDNKKAGWIFSLRSLQSVKSLLAI